MTIGQVAKAAGVPASAIRYYESTGVIPRPSRKNGVRQYGPEAIDDLKALRFYRATGIPIRGLVALGAKPRGTAAHRAVWAQVIRARITDLDAWMREAAAIKELLERVAACRCHGRRDECEVLRAADAMEMQ